MTKNEFIESLIKSAKLDPLYEAAGPDAWDDPRTTIREIATAIQQNDPQALMEAIKPSFEEYLEGVAEYRGIELEDQDPIPFEHDAQHASDIIDRDEASYYNSLNGLI